MCDMVLKKILSSSLLPRGNVWTYSHQGNVNMLSILLFSSYTKVLHRNHLIQYWNFIISLRLTIIVALNANTEILIRSCFKHFVCILPIC